MEMSTLCLPAIFVWLLCFINVNGICMDIDRVACQMLHAKRADMCNDARIAESVCPGLCRKCPVKCYHSDIPLTDYHDCNKTRTCALGEMCMLKELKSSVDGHIVYFMSCATQQECDGFGLAFFLGKRNIMRRDVHVRCCNNDLCNLPLGFPRAQTTSHKPAIRTAATTLPRAQTTSHKPAIHTATTTIRPKPTVVNSHSVGGGGGCGRRSATFHRRAKLFGLEGLYRC